MPRVLPHPPSASGIDAMLFDLIENVPYAVWELTTDAEGRAREFKFLSKSAEPLLGHPYEFLLEPSNWGRIVHSEDYEYFEHKSAEPFADDGRKIYQHRIITADGRIIPIEATLTLVRDSHGTPVALRGVTLDISERYRSMERWKTLAETSDALSESHDLPSTLRKITQMVVPASADICSIHLRDEPGGPLIPVQTASTPELETMLRESAERFPPRAETRAMILSVLESKQSFVIDVTDEFRRANSTSEEHYEFQKRMNIRSAIITPLFVDEELLGVILLSVIGTRPALTEEDRWFIENLARQASVTIHNVRLLNRSRELAGQAEIANRAKDQFIANLSHELRTPLAPVLATVELLAEDPDFPESFKSSLELIRRNVEIEARLIDDLLDMTRVAKGKLRFVETEVDLHAIIPEVLETCQQDFDRGQLRLVVQLRATNSFLRGDRDRLSQVLWNVLRNATKFTPEAGLIIIRTSNDNSGAILVEIEDTGCGIEPRELKQIFDPFEQRAAGKGSYGGLGLGLAISKSIVELHGGTIEARSMGVGYGSTFTIRLADSHSDSRAAISPAIVHSTLPSKSRSGRILMVDDHLDTNAAIKVLLERRGYKVTTASTVARGLELARLHPFDILVSDIGLPDGDGIDLLRAIRADKQIASPMHAIAVSGYGTEADVERSLKAGFKYHLRKPVAFPDLERAIAEVLAGA